MKKIRGPLIVRIAACFLVFVTISTYLVFDRNPSEVAQRDELRKLGALVSMDGTGQRVASVNCSTLEEDASLQDVLQIIGTLRTIASLDLGRTAVTDADVEAVNHISSLSSLSLSDDNISDVAVVHITQLNNLIALYLSGTNVTDASLPRIASLGSLKILDLSGTSVKGDLGPIGAMTNLEWLVLSRLDLQDGALRELQGAPSLKRVSLKDAKVGAEDIEALQSSHPDITIDQ